MSSTLAPSAPVPSVIRTRPMIASANVTPTKENPPSSDRAGALYVPRLEPSCRNSYGGLVGQIHVAQHDSKAAHQRRRRLAGNPELLVELVAADRREDLA